MTLSIRRMCAGDVPSVAALCGELGYPVSREVLAGRFAGIHGDSRHDVFVAVLGDRIAGWLHVFEQRMLESDSYAEIGGLVVGADFRRRGVGSALVDEARRWTLARGLDVLRVRSSTARDGAHRFYPALGFAALKTQAVYTLRPGDSGVPARGA